MKIFATLRHAVAGWVAIIRGTPDWRAHFALSLPGLVTALALSLVARDGIKVVQKDDKNAPKGVDRVVVADPSAPPLWARFYTIGTNKPFFSDRDGIAKDSLAEIGYERRNGYAWYTNSPAALLAEDYPAWRRRVGR